MDAKLLQKNNVLKIEYCSGNIADEKLSILTHVRNVRLVDFCDSPKSPIFLESLDLL